jgi:lipopolysaccharide export system protein LptA
MTLPAAALGALLVALFAPAAPAAPPQQRTVRMDEVSVRAQTTQYDGDSHVYRVIGDVHMEVRDLKVACKEALIVLSHNDERVDRLVFIGDVVAVRGRSTFRGDRVTYTVATRKLVAEGNTRTRVLLPASGSAETSRRK